MGPPVIANVVLVDDDEGVRKSLTRLLTRSGHTVRVAGTVEEALALVSAEAPDVVVSDIAMPGASGIELLRRLRGTSADLPVVIMTGGPTIETAAQAVQYGATRYLTKPVDALELEEVVAYAARLNRLARLKRQAFAALDHDPVPSDLVDMEAAFDRALDGLFVVAQPIVIASRREIAAHEMLLRSVEPTMPRPDAVLRAASLLGRLRDVGRTVRRRVAAIAGEAPPGAMLFVNISPEELLDDDLADEGAPLSAHATRVVLEITERATLFDVADLRGRLARLRALGYRLALDDLGAGYAGLSSFAQLEPEYVKLDMSLVRDIDGDRTRQAIVRSMTSLCHELGVPVVAEGIETPEERASIVDLGCDLLQGYHFAKPGKPFPPIG